MRFNRLGAGLGVAVLLGVLPAATASRAAAQGKGVLASKTVHGKLEMVNRPASGWPSSAAPW